MDKYGLFKGLYPLDRQSIEERYVSHLIFVDRGYSLNE
jgi:hypothetical protein